MSWPALSDAICRDPDTAWAILGTKQKPAQVKAIDPSITPRPPGHLRFVCISDTHNFVDLEVELALLARQYN